MKTSEKRIEELAEFLNIDRADIVPDDYTDNQFNTPDGDYLVLTDEEADNATAEYIKYSIWAFNPEFIISECGLCNNLSYPESCDLINSHGKEYASKNFYIYRIN